MLEAKKEYNAMLERYNKAVDYFGSAEKHEIKMKQIDNFKKVANGLSRLLREIKDYTVDEALKGFKE